MKAIVETRNGFVQSVRYEPDEDGEADKEAEQEAETKAKAKAKKGNAAG